MIEGRRNREADGRTEKGEKKNAIRTRDQRKKQGKKKWKRKKSTKVGIHIPRPCTRI